MSQVDYIHFLNIFVWAFILMLMYYFTICVFYVRIYYTVIAKRDSYYKSAKFYIHCAFMTKMNWYKLNEINLLFILKKFRFIKAQKFFIYRSLKKACILI